MRRILSILAASLLSGFTAVAQAVSCGTIAVPTACSITVGGIATYTFSGFVIGTVYRSGIEGNLYLGADISIDLSIGTGRSALLTFSKNTANPNNDTIFFTYAGTNSYTSFSYDVAITRAAVGGVLNFAPPVRADLNGSSKTNDATGVHLVTIANLPACTAAVGVNGDHADCALPPGPPATLHVTSSLNLLGNTGNIIVGSITHRFDSSYVTGHIDVDGNGSYDALTDGLLMLRYLLGVRGAGLITGAIGVGATRTTAMQIELYIQTLMP